MTSLEQTLNELESFFRHNESQLVLVSYATTHEVRLQLLDIDEYRAGSLVCEEVITLCISTRWQEFNLLTVYRRHNLPPAFSYMRERLTDDLLLLVLNPVEDEDEPSLLPMIDGHRLAYIICKSAHYEEEQNPGR
jgi:hypothetical protein